MFCGRQAQRLKQMITFGPEAKCASVFFRTDAKLELTVNGNQVSCSSNQPSGKKFSL